LSPSTGREEEKKKKGGKGEIEAKEKVLYPFTVSPLGSEPTD